MWSMKDFGISDQRRHHATQAHGPTSFYPVPFDDMPASPSRLPSSPLEFGGVTRPTTSSTSTTSTTCASAAHGSISPPESPPLFSEQQEDYNDDQASRSHSMCWQEMSNTCRDLLSACRQAEHADLDGQDVKKVQDHIKKMAGLCKVLNDTITQKKKRRSKWTTYHYYSPSRSSWYRDEAEAQEQGTMKRSCQQCNTTKSPEWRSGPLGSKTLCNACGIRYSKTLRQERPANPLSIKNLLN